MIKVMVVDKDWLHGNDERLSRGGKHEWSSETLLPGL
jgi:hypothetical protein